MSSAQIPEVFYQNGAAAKKTSTAAVDSPAFKSGSCRVRSS